jgi:hypothetical protein
MALAEAKRRARELVDVEGHSPELGCVVAAFQSPVEPLLKRLGGDFPVLREGLLVHREQRLVVLAGPVASDREALEHGLGRLFGEVDLHSPEVPDELVATLLDEPAAVLVDDVCVQPRQITLAGPGLGEVEQLAADPSAARLGMDARLVLEVGQGGLAAGACVSDDASACEREPRVGCQTSIVEAPPLAQLLAGEPDRVLLVEVEPVAGVEERGDLVGVVERRRAEGDLVQSGWPDSNRRLLAPKASTLTRLSYTPRLHEV